ncbi:sodium-dependent bicarbonate transport family permease [Halalkalibacter akibai]|uniref:Sodium-dependent bicarbonate transporter n=1 Tax=Halalkalibacter akibai (strain ATCC 43226 / DSM 21942 / CIP 109018 / JCM 9157 / 1139) TaxID=1236973 RepID=W4QXK6_HALA3|nr:sodium-dependent bicarbonate transport family permease [Halalkalibacter akibai]GAE36865.1 sodium-dependent bicarbonate transporter [Halalkalibacter akibai JCM 9157]
MYEIIVQNLLSPVVLFFVLGLIAALLKSDLKFPSALNETLSIFLLVAIGLKGGIELSKYSFQEVISPVIATLVLGSLLPIIVLFLLKIIKLDTKNAIGLAATYGSVSIVTYGAAISFLDHTGTSYEGFMNAMVVLMESPAIIISLILLKVLERKKEDSPVLTPQKLAFQSPVTALIDKEVLKEAFFGKSIMLLLGALLIGLIAGEKAIPAIQPLFIDLYSSVLILFLLSMGLTAGERLPEVKKHGPKLLLFGIIMPIIGGILGVGMGHLIGLSLGGMTLMGVLAGSASYIAAPAALRTSVPDANPSIYLGLALGITFPFNLIVGIPLFYQFAQWLS